MTVTAELSAEPILVRQGAEAGIDHVPVLDVHKASGAEWDAAIADFDGVCQEQLHAFASVRWPNVTHEPRLFMRNGRVVGGALVMVQALPLRLGHIAICKWAPMLADRNDADVALIRADMIAALQAEYARERGMMLSILAHASAAPVNADYVSLKQRGFRSGIQLPHPHRYMVNLRLEDEALKASFHQTWRRQLNKSMKSDLSFEHAGPEQLGAFKTLYEAMTDRKNFPDYSAYDSLDRLMALDEKLRPELFFVRHESEIVAGALIFKAGDRAVYLYGATNDQALPLRAGYFMHWHVIRWLRDHTRASWYDLGGTDGFSGLHQFKAGMVGEAGVIRSLPPVMNFAAQPLAYWLGMGAYGAREAMHRALRLVAGFRSTKAVPDMPRAPLDEQFR